SFGANANSSFYYNKMKGTLEQNMKKLNLSQLVILHPGFIERPNSTRMGEKTIITALKFFNAIGLFKGYEPLPTNRLAKAMIASFFEFKEKLKIVSLKEIKVISV